MGNAVPLMPIGLLIEAFGGKSVLGCEILTAVTECIFKQIYGDMRISEIR